jgi:hypothetical protein
MFHRYLPKWFGPSDRQIVRGFFEGRQDVPWGAWAVPMLAWGAFYVALFGTMFCFNALVEKQWIDRERLTFPLLYIPLELTRNVGAPQGASILRQRIFWMGVAIPFTIGSFNALHRYFPTVPQIPLQFPLVPDGSVSPPWTGLGTMDLTISFPLIAIAFIVPADISLSCWFFHFITRIENIIGTLRTGTAPNVYTSAFPALYYQGSGAMVMLFFLLCWSARKHLKQAVTGLWRKRSDGKSSPQHSPSVPGFLLGLLFLSVWLKFAGMSLITITWFLGTLFIFLIVFTRVRAETGLGALLPPMFTNELMFLPLGTRFFSPQDLTLLQALRPVYRMMGVLWTVQGQMESFKIADEARLSKRAVGWAMMVAMVLGFFLAFALALQVFYRYGFINLPAGLRGRGYLGSQGYWSYGNLFRYLTQPEETDTGGLLGMAAGAIICWTTAFMRARFTWFPLHPVGFMSAHSWGMHLNWFPFLLGWTAKVSLVRYGGLTIYRRALPFFVGLLVGSTLGSGVWGLVGWAVGKPMEI